MSSLADLHWKEFTEVGMDLCQAKIGGLGFVDQERWDWPVQLGWEGDVISLKALHTALESKSKSPEIVRIQNAPFQILAAKWNGHNFGQGYLFVGVDPEQILTPRHGAGLNFLARQLEQNQRAEVLYRRTLHDLNNPLAILRACAQTQSLLIAQAQPDVQKLGRIAERIDATSERMSLYLSVLLDKLKASAQEDAADAWSDQEPLCNQSREPS